MANLNTADKWLMVKDIINDWLRDRTMYCGNCDENYHPATFPCCKDPALGTNAKHCKDIMEAIKDLRKVQLNEYASNKEMTFRTTIKLPKRLFALLEQYFANQGRKLFENDKERNQFMRKFPVFSVPEKV